MWAFPLAAAIVALAFAVVLGLEFGSRPRAHLGLWLAALLMYAGASFAMFVGLLVGWSTPAFRVYWLLGLLNVPFLAVGEVYLLSRWRWVAHVLFIALVFGTAFAIAYLRWVPVHVSALERDLPLGKEAFGDGTLAHRMAQLYSIPAYAILVIGLTWSAFRLRAGGDARGRFMGLLAVAWGATVVAIGSGFGAGYDVVPLFSVSLAVGAALMFWGFLRASRARDRPKHARVAIGF